MSKITKLSQLEPGVYDEARKDGLSLTAWLERESRAGNIGEELIPAPGERHKRSDGSALSAFEELLLHAGIRTRGDERRGIQADTGDIFFSQPDNRILFPEFVASVIRDYTMEPLNELQLGDLVALRMGIDGTRYEGLQIDDAQIRRTESGRVTEGAELPRVRFTLAEHAQRLPKFGKVLEVTYEVVRRMRLDVFALYVRLTTAAERRRKVRHAIDVLVNGTGNGDPAINANHSGAWTRAALIQLLILAMQNGEDIGILAMDATEFAEVLALADTDNKTPAEAGFADRGTLPAFYGMAVRMAPVDSLLTGSNKILALPRNRQLVEVFENGSIIQETDRLITSQWQHITWSENATFGKLTKTGAFTLTQTA